MRGQDLSMDMEISLRDSYFGFEKRVSLQGNRYREVKVKIPKGINTGQKLRLSGKGLSGGDLYLIVKVRDDPVFQRDGDDLTVEREIKLTEAVMGAGIDIPTMKGSKRIKIPPMTQSHTRIRIKNQGMPRFKENGYGDLYVRIVIRFPERITPAQARLFQELEKEGL